MIKKNSSLVYQRKDNELVILNMNNGKYYGLQDTAIEMWDYIDRYNTEELIYEHIKETYKNVNDDYNEMYEEIMMFLKELVKEGLLTCEKG